MSGYLPGEPEPTEDCPYCGTECHADFADVGVGHVQCGPYHCDNCHASQIGPYDEDRLLTEVETKHGWYAPESEPGSSANVIGGRIVGHKEMNLIYRSTFTDNPEYEVPGVVEEWRETIRTMILEFGIANLKNPKPSMMDWTKKVK